MPFILGADGVFGLKLKVQIFTNIFLMNCVKIRVCTQQIIAFNFQRSSYMSTEKEIYVREEFI